MLPQSLSHRSPSGPKVRGGDVVKFPPLRANNLGYPSELPTTGAMAPVRVAAGAVFVLSGAASWLLPDPWTPPPPTCDADFNEDPACAPESEAAPSAPLPAPPQPGDGATTCAAGSSGCTAAPAAPTFAPLAPTRPSTASSAASPPTEGPDPLRRRGGPPPPPPPLDSGDPGASGNEFDSWLYQCWRWVLWSLESWCGPFCWRIGAAARAAGYLMVSSVTFFVFYGAFVVWTCVLHPAGRLAWFVCRYLVGRAPWATPESTDAPAPRPEWCGPEFPRPWTSLYVRKEVRGRSLDHRQPHDLLVCHEGDARLRHGPLKGRTNRKGLVCAYDEVHGCSNCHLRRQLETEPMRVHLCASGPCLDPGAAAVHIA